jgi:thioredoxin-related protein
MRIVKVNGTALPGRTRTELNPTRNAHHDNHLYGHTMRTLRRLLVFLFVVAAGAAHAEAPAGYPMVSFGEGLRLAHDQNKPVFVYFGRYGCAFCDKTNKESFSNPDIKRRYTDHYVLVYVDSESGKQITLPSGEQLSEMDLAARYRIIGTPTFVFLDAAGKTLARAPGAKTIQDLTDLDEFINTGAYKTESLSKFLSGKK